MHLDGPRVHHGTHDMLGIPFLHLRTFPARLAHCHNGNLFRAPHDTRDSRVRVHLGFCANFVRLYACEAADQCIERDDRVESVQSDDTVIQMSKKCKTKNKEKHTRNENSKRFNHLYDSHNMLYDHRRLLSLII